MARSFTQTAASTPHVSVSELYFRHPAFGIRVQVSTHLPKKMRRQILLRLYRVAKPVFCHLGSATLDHSDSGLFSLYRDMYRPVSLHQAVGFGSDAMNVGFQIRLKRLAHGLTQEKFAARCGLARSHLSRIEHGRKKIQPLTWRKIDRAFLDLERSHTNAHLDIPTERPEGGRPKAGPGGDRGDGNRKWCSNPGKR